MYVEGCGVERDPKKAIEFYEKAIKNGSSNIAKVELGVLYRDGTGVNVDYKKAVSLFEDAIKESNDANAYNFLGNMYANGFGVTQNYKKAFALYKESYAYGNFGVSLINIGCAYYKGFGVEQDYEKALVCFTKASQHQQVADDAFNNLAVMYCRGHGVPKDYDKAFDYLCKGINISPKLVKHVNDNFYSKVCCNKEQNKILAKTLLHHMNRSNCNILFKISNDYILFQTYTQWKNSNCYDVDIDTELRSNTRLLEIEIRYWKSRAEHYTNLYDNFESSIDTDTYVNMEKFLSSSKS